MTSSAISNAAIWLKNNLDGIGYYRQPSQADLDEHMQYRVSMQIGLQQRRMEFTRSDASSVRAIGQMSAELSEMRSAFVAKYGDDAIDQKLLRVLATDASDEVRLSDEAVSMLEDLQKMEKMRGELEFREGYAQYLRDSRPIVLKLEEAFNANYAAGFDLFTLSSESDRIAAAYSVYNNRLQAAELRADIAVVQDRRRTAEAAVEASAAVLTEGLEGPKLFDVNVRGQIRFDARGLEDLTPDARERAQLVRLAEVLGGRNGLSEVRGALAKALDVQNEYIASHPVVRAVEAEEEPAGPAAPTEAQLEMKRMYEEDRAKAEAGVRRALAEDAAQKAKLAARGATGAGPGAGAAPADAEDPKTAQHKAALELLKRIADGLKRDAADGGKQPDALVRALSVVA